MSSDIEKNTGRPLKFKSVEELQKKIDKFFNETPKDEWTWTGLALALDTDREVLTSYRNGKGRREPFSAPLKRAFDMVTNGYEIDLKQKGRVGSIFALKQVGWVDKVEIENTHNININGLIAGNEEKRSILENANVSALEGEIIEDNEEMA